MNMSGEMEWLQIEINRLKACLELAHAGIDTAMNMMRSEDPDLVRIGAVMTLARVSSTEANFIKTEQILREGAARRSRTH